MTTLFDPNDLIETVKTVDPDKDYYSELVGEGKKFTDNLALARAKAESDLFIERLQNENKKVRDALTKSQSELSTRTSLDEFLQKVKDAQTTPIRQDTPPDNPVLDEDKIAQLIESRLTAKERANLEAGNIRAAQEGLIKAFGQDYVPTLNEKAQELGVSSEFLDNLAKTAPKAFFATLGINPNEQKTIFTPPPNTVIPGRGSNTQAKNYKHYADQRKKLPPEKYYSPEFQNEMFESAKKLGAAFYE